MMTWMCFRTELEGPRPLFGGRILIWNMLRQFFSRWIEIGKPRNQCSRLKEQGFSWLNWLFLFLKEWTCVLRYSGQACQLQTPNLSQSQMARRVQPQWRHCWEVCDMTFSELPQPFNLNGYKKVWRKKTRKYKFRWLELEFPTQNWYFMTLRFLGNGFIASYQLEDGEVNIDGFAKLLCKLVGSGTPRWKDSIWKIARKKRWKSWKLRHGEIAIALQHLAIL